MRLIIGIVAGWSFSLLVQASDFDSNIPKSGAQKLPLPTYVGNFPTGALPPSAPLRESPVAHEYESPLVRAISQAKTIGVIERGVEGYTDVLIKCQKKQSVVHTTALLRSDAQRDHCYRF